MSSTPFSSLHFDLAEFKAALEFTQAETGFQSLLIEKDYYCSLVLHEMYRLDTGDPALVFKGGTCLNKVHLGFYRLSEDLDFCISVPIDATRRTRSKAKEPAREILNALPGKIPGFKIRAALAGSNNSTQYNAELTYPSVLNRDPGRIKIEISVREPLVHASVRKDALTLALNPFTRKPAVAPVSVQVIDLFEAMAEKVRAALSRRQPAIRDLFDLGYAQSQKRLPARDAAFLALVRRKLDVPGNARLLLTKERLEEFRRQIETELRPVLREQDFEGFHFEEVTKLVLALDRALATRIRSES